MRRTLPIIALFVLAAAAPGQANRDDLTPLDISYRLTVLSDLKTVRVDMQVEGVRRPILRVSLPNWIPGTYFIGRFGEQIEKLDATGADGAPLPVTRLDHQTWSIETQGSSHVTASYLVPQRRGRFRRRGNADAATPITGLRVSGPTTFVYVVGAKERPVTVTYVIPKGWRIANGLLSTDDPMTRRAKDYDTFIDAPTILGKFEERHFAVNGTPFTCVYFSNDQRYDFDLDAFTDICRRIVSYQGSLYGSYPFPNYVFLFTLPGGGGLEHLNSTSIGLSPAAMKRDVRSGASVAAHEFFHTWNVKRIRPKVLGPFEYEHEDYTGNLWVSEGWTSYYGDLTLVRTGIDTREQFLKKLAGAARRELNKESRKEHSVYWASRNVWHRRPDEKPRVDYYGKGELLGALIDLEIRNATDNRKSLDDVMRFMNRWFAERNVGFEEGDIERACTAISNHDFGEFFARYVRGTLDPPLKRCLAYAGIDYSEKHIEADLPFAYRRFGKTLMVVGRRDGKKNDVGVSRGDVITALNGDDAVRPAALLEKSRPGDRVKLAFKRGGTEKEIDVTLVKHPTMIPTIQFIPNPTERQRRIRESWLTGRMDR